MNEVYILADANIPRVEPAFGELGTVHTKPGRAISSADVQEADVLLVRSVTPVDSDLLGGTDLRFVGSATIGTDHVDREYLEARDIPFAHAPGSNADSVADYVVVALLLLARRQGTELQGRTVGIVGCGNIGRRLARRLQALGMTVLRNDPPRARAAEAAGRTHTFLPLDAVLEEAEVVTLHVPLKTEGPDPTHHLADAAFLERMNEGAWMLNTSRGLVVDGEALRGARVHGPVAAAVLDVWEHEPIPDPTLVDAVDLATPHVAGYAYDGKVRGTAMLYEALCEHLGGTAAWEGPAAIEPISKDELHCSPPDPRLPDAEWLYQLARQGYDLQTDDAALRAVMDQAAEDRAEAFSGLRSDYRRRRKLQQHHVHRTAVPSAHRRAVEAGLTMQLR
ncbi:MAG: erythronate-4-phosphate dehydrogenase [Bacteroidetes bacterium QS_1_63_11]|nr:MAG: erythronate-4-phosphate dehydrogenase [Bacteroidetes bacterium QS_1_63_11]